MSVADLDVLMARIIERKAAIKAEEEALRWDLDTLETLHADGVIDPKFAWDDWSFSRSPGRISYDYPPEIVALEIELQDRRQPKSPPPPSGPSAHLSDEHRYPPAHQCANRAGSF